MPTPSSSPSADPFPSSSSSRSAFFAPVSAIGQCWPNRVIPAKSQTRNASKRPVLLKISRDRPTLAYHRKQARNLVGILSAEALPASHVAACYRFTPSRLRHLPRIPIIPQANFIHLPIPPPPPTLVTRKPAFPRQKTTSTYRTLDQEIYWQRRVQWTLHHSERKVTNHAGTIWESEAINSQ